ncbi:CDP-diacylglycerol--glycerol-3-phosphate 3-phosphatidyltransferase [Anaplasma phagocytophilum]|uniref:CDP-diacylglycerol--glycerol-3-phosphate 3-phosphatidyltransferase n=1 Tax=Anaplasma phagocytophilum TaxID=948 RepID=UPI0007DF2B92|nr:CDP-diacylglycerol--glycerol-3-phosphate 3-phosphatidyltransferase [Anaplasma phagocytophilum]SCV66517.1 CDP-diacylglycerol--glycerol-3-phosphate 3-phosphatidyltransferase [Anaplasma phagocytophilum]
MRKIFPNLLTIFRVLAIPAVVASFYINCGACAQYVTLLIFIFACVTDFFDGYLARMWGVQSRFGRIFDPAADKLIVLSTFVMLVYTNKITGIPVLFVIIIMCREVLVSCMREFLIAANISVPVSEVGKVKTVMQMIATALLILNYEFIVRLGEIFLCIAAILSLHSMCLYTRNAIMETNKK